MSLRKIIDTVRAAASGSFTPITTFAGLDESAVPGALLRQARDLAKVFRSEFAGTGQPASIATYDLMSLPYPVAFGLWRAASTPVPYLSITNRMVVVRWNDADGRRRTLLFEPSDTSLGGATPYFAGITATTPAFVVKRISAIHGTVEQHLAAAGIAPEEVDYLVFDHLHTQDVRRWIGTTAPAPDLNSATPVTPLFPNAKLIVHRRELEGLVDMHPLQEPWYLPASYADLRPEGLLIIDGDVLLGPGVALLATPGHSPGNQTLVLNTATGIWATSENAIAAECFTPEHSRIPGVAKWAKRWGQEVILNANTLENTARQYASMIIEKTIVDRSTVDSRFLQFMPSSELSRHWAFPGTAPTFCHGGIRQG